MDLMGMMSKLKDTQDKIDETKKRLENTMINQSSLDGLLKITISANLVLKLITIDDLLLEDKKKLEDSLIVTINKAILSAMTINKTELDAVAKVDMPMIPGIKEMFK